MRLVPEPETGAISGRFIFPVVLKWRDFMAQYKSVVTINFSVFLMMLGVGMIVALLPQRIMELSGSFAQVGYLAAAFAVSNVLLQIPMGKLADKIGFKPFIAGGYFICSLTGLLYYFSEKPILIFLGRLLQGVGEVPIWALAPALLSVKYPAEKGKFIGMYNASLHIGLTMGCVLIIIISKNCQTDQIFLLFAAVSFLAGMLIVLFVDNPPQERNLKPSKHFSDGTGLLLGHFSNRIVLAGIVLYGASYGIFITIIPAFLISVNHSDQVAVGVFFALFYIALSLSQLIAGPFSDRNGRKPAMIFGLAMAAIGIALFSAVKQPWLMGLLTLASLGLGVFCVTAMAFLNESVPRSLKGTVSGAFYFSWGVGFFIGPLILGKLGHSDHWQTGFLLLAGLILIELILLCLAAKNTWVQR